MSQVIIMGIYLMLNFAVVGTGIGEPVQKGVTMDAEKVKLNVSFCWLASEKKTSSL